MFTPREWKNPSKSRPNDPPYTTQLLADGKLVCDCRPWKFPKPGNARRCGHTDKAVKEMGGMAVPRGEFTYLANAGAVETPRFQPVTERGPREVGGAVCVASSPEVPGPMLASAMVDRVEGEAFDRRYSASAWVMEEKIDGHRCTVVVRAGQVAAFSRPQAGSDRGNVRELPAHILAQLERFPDGIYDGELVADIPGGTSSDVTALSSRLLLCLFDVLQLRGDDVRRRAYSIRRALLLDVLAEMPDDQQAITTVESVPPSWAGVQAIWQRRGEGAVVKRLDSVYQSDCRSADWIKVVEAKVAPLVVFGYEAGKCGPYSKLKLRDAAGVETTCKTLGNKMLRDIAAAPDAFIGRVAVVKYRTKTPTGKYKHIVFDHWAGPAEQATTPAPAATSAPTASTTPAASEPTAPTPDAPTARPYRGQPFRCAHCKHAGDKSYDGCCPRADCFCHCADLRDTPPPSKPTTPKPATDRRAAALKAVATRRARRATEAQADRDEHEARNVRHY